MRKAIKCFFIRTFYRKRVVRFKLDAAEYLKAGDIMHVAEDNTSYQFLCLGRGKFIRQSAISKISVNISPGNLMDIML